MKTTNKPKAVKMYGNGSILIADEIPGYFRKSCGNNTSGRMVLTWWDERLNTVRSFDGANDYEGYVDEWMLFMTDPRVALLWRVDGVGPGEEGADCFIIDHNSEQIYMAAGAEKIAAQAFAVLGKKSMFFDDHLKSWTIREFPKFILVIG